MHLRPRGFTLPELIIVIVVGSILAATVAVFFGPAVQGWLALRVRGDMADQAAAALFTMKRDVRLAVPNSIRLPNDKCFELVPTSTGGRFRKQPDPVNGGNALDLAAAAPNTAFDVLSPLSLQPAVGDHVVVDNQNANDVYAGSNRSTITAVSGAQSAGGVTLRTAGITLASGISDPGYEGGRFVVVPAATPSVFYVCSGAGSSSGAGTGTLYRLVRPFNAAYPSACPSTAGGAVLATRVKTCSFVYSPTQGATQQNGFVSMQLELQRNNEAVTLLVGAHVMNAP